MKKRNIAAGAEAGSGAPVPEMLRIQRDLGIALSSTSDIRTALRRVLSAAMEVDCIDAGGTYLVRHSSRTVELVAHRGLSRPFVREVSSYDFAAPLARKVIRGRPTYVGHPRIRDYPLFVREGLCAVAAFPVRYSRDVIAIVNVASRSCPVLPRSTRALIAAIASQIAVVVPRIRAEADLREAQQSLHSLFDSVEDLLFVLDDEGRVLEVNRAVTELLHLPRRRLLGHSVLAVHPPRLRRETKAQLARLLSGAQAVCDIPLRSASGAEIPAETRVTRGRWKGKPVLFGISRDVRDRQQMEQEIVRISEMQKTRIAQDLHDNLMQQLYGIRVMATSLKQRLPPSARAARETAERILGLSGDVLASVRRTALGLAPLAPVEGGMAVALRRLTEDARQVYGCDCRMQCRVRTARMDAALCTQLYYIAQEAIRNAWSHGKARRIDVRLSVGRHAGVLEVEDDGSGIGASARSQAGMGLRIMAYRANLIGGQFLAVPRAGGGTAVRCSFIHSRVRPQPSARR